MNIDKRKKQLLELVVENYVDSGDPVGSTFLVEDGDLDVSGATVRNEMQELEQEGLVTQPHTSAGRIPTEEGYRYYVRNMMEPQKPKDKKKESIENLFEKENRQQERQLKQAAKYAAEDISAAVIVAFDHNNVYYTGLSKLFSQPEFKDYNFTLHVSQIFDHCEEQIPMVERILEGNLDVLIGSENPLGGNCSLVASRLGGSTLFMVLGPMRMNYSLAVGFNQFLQKKEVS